MDPLEPFDCPIFLLLTKHRLICLLHIALRTREAGGLYHGSANGLQPYIPGTHNSASGVYALPRGKVPTAHTYVDICMLVYV
jgi:hypothetical protein